MRRAATPTRALQTAIWAVGFLLGPGLGLHAALNDDFADRFLLEGDAGQVAGDNEGASDEPGEPRHAGSRSGGRSVWWSWTPSADGLATVHTLRSDFDTLLAVYTGDSVEALTAVASNDDVRDLFVDQSRVTFAVTGGTAYQIAVDGFDDSGEILLTWALHDAGDEPPANDAFAARRPLRGATGTDFGASHSATKEDGEPDHGRRPGGRSIWWSWIAPSDGVATFDTLGSSFDTLLGAYSGSDLGDLTELGFNDNADVGETASRVVFNVLHRREYFIAADGFDGAGGVVMLNWRLSTLCRNASAPVHPRPGDEGFDVDRFTVELRWNGEPPVQAEVIFGEDNRHEFYEVSEPQILRAWEASATIVPTASLIDNRNGTFSLPSRTFGEDYNLCPGVRFADQPVAGGCSAFLVGPDLLVTAGHCIGDIVECGEVAAVFGYRMEGPRAPVLTFDQSDIYFCAGVVGTELVGDGADWSVLRLDRVVRGHRPVPIRRSGRIAANQEVFVIGYPKGLPAKYSDRAFVTDNVQPSFFGANLDGNSGNSGSPVFNAATLEVEGVLVRGPPIQFINNGAGCLTNVLCSDDGSNCIWVESTRTTLFAALIPPLPPDPDPDPEPEDVVYEVYLGPADGEMEQLGETDGTVWTLARPLEEDTVYEWQIVAKVDCGFTPGPVWTFRTAGGAVEPRFRRGDVFDDGALNLTDAVNLLLHLFRGGAEPPCVKSADADDSGQVILTDPVYILNHLFRSGPAPREPSAECGVDPSDDDLTCESYRPCEA